MAGKLGRSPEREDTMRYLFTIMFIITVLVLYNTGVAGPVCAQFAPPVPMPGDGPPPCITQIVTGPGGRVQVCTTCYNPYGAPTTFCS